jgi:hypothetical protein
MHVDVRAGVGASAKLPCRALAVLQLHLLTGLLSPLGNFGVDVRFGRLLVELDNLLLGLLHVDLSIGVTLGPEGLFLNLFLQPLFLQSLTLGSLLQNHELGLQLIFLGQGGHAQGTSMALLLQTFGHVQQTIVVVDHHLLRDLATYLVG